MYIQNRAKTKIFLLIAFFSCFQHVSPIEWQDTAKNLFENVVTPKQAAVAASVAGAGLLLCYGAKCLLRKKAIFLDYVNQKNTPINIIALDNAAIDRIKQLPTDFITKWENEVKKYNNQINMACSNPLIKVLITPELATKIDNLEKASNTFFNNIRPLEKLIPNNIPVGLATITVTHGWFFPKTETIQFLINAPELEAADNRMHSQESKITIGSNNGLFLIQAAQLGTHKAKDLMKDMDLLFAVTTALGISNQTALETYLKVAYPNDDFAQKASVILFALYHIQQALNNPTNIINTTTQFFTNMSSLELLQEFAQWFEESVPLEQIINSLFGNQKKYNGVVYKSEN